MTKISNNKIDEIMEDLIIGHNFEYAGSKLKELFRNQYNEGLNDSYKVFKKNLDYFAHKEMAIQESDKEIDKLLRENNHAEN